MLHLDDSYARLDGLSIPWRGAAFPRPRLFLFNRDLAEALGLPEALESGAGAALLCGMDLPEGWNPVAQAYAGHQFGRFVPRLGDGRALLLGEFVGRDGMRRDLHLKGSGPTPFSRGGDGKAVLGPMLREYVMGEAMHALGIPTTRALAVVVTGETVLREGLRPGAVLARVAASHLRVGTFQYAAAHLGTAGVRRLADYAIRRHDPDLGGAAQPYLALLERVVERQVDLVARWMAVGFVHGVMNTDNTTLSGETIDYGPCAFMEAHDPETVFSSIDHMGRYAYGRQPEILAWNLARFAETLLPLIDPDDPERAVTLASERIHAIPDRYRARWLERMGEKLGLRTPRPEDEGLLSELLRILTRERVDHTLAFRTLADAAEGRPAPFRALFQAPSPIDAWLDRWRARLAQEPMPAPERAAAMRRVNPLYIPRNHKVEEALAAAEAGDAGPLRTLLEVLARPYEERPGLADYAEPAPAEFGPYRTTCGT